MFDTIKPLPLVSKMLRLCTITDRVTESLLKHTKEQRCKWDLKLILQNMEKIHSDRFQNEIFF